MTAQRPVTPTAIAALGLAQLSGYLGFVPLFALLLPRRAVAIAGSGAPQLLSAVLLAGAICASIAHIAVGRLGDVWLRHHGSRRALIAAGMLGTGAAIAAMGQATRPWTLGLSTIVMQAMLNLLLAPLSATLPDHVPDAQKGMAAAIFGLALPLAGLGTTVLARIFPADGAAGFAGLGGIVVAGCLPLVLVWPLEPAGSAGSNAPPGPAALPARVSRALSALWLSRLLVQLGAVFVLNYFFLALAAARPIAEASALTGRLSLAATICVIGLLPTVARWSDRHDRRKPVMMAAGLVAGIAIAVLGQVYRHDAALIAVWACLHVALSAYLAIDAALVATLLAGHALRGQALGLMNLAHTLPAIVVPGAIALGQGASLHLSWAAALSLAAGGPLIAVLCLASFAVPARNREAAAQAWFRGVADDHAW